MPSFEEPMPSLPSSPLLLEPLERFELPSMPEEPTEPERRLGSFERFSERPIFWPNSADESLFDCPTRDDVERLTLPALVLLEL
jgi:hypothetical protein